MKIELKSIETKQDITTLSPLVEKIWREVFPPIIGAAQTEYMLRHYQSTDDIQREIATGVQYYLIEAENGSAGYLAFDIHEDYLFISKLYLLGSEQNKGLSSYLFDWLEKQAHKAGKSRLHLHVNRHNEKAISVYQHKGFSIVQSAVSDIGNGFVMDDYYMEKTITNFK
ncbi:GNAT family N-acetyltransferase [Amphibacillus sp. Q70]|uniref:GNAT family N-acetyltransferase n=1 Tax=Amphibacillus sp. Q70 TaxID=3453416 RepID=UPI003F8592D5